MFEQYNRFFDELKLLFAQMDETYDDVAGAYGFACSGCTENCCLTRFFHHTVAEFLYLRKGFAGLDENMQAQILEQAVKVNKKVMQAEADGRIARVMCPLNMNGLCVLYEYRPMICRLHGIPHEFAHPVKNKILGPGCHEFEAQCSQKQYMPFDRTPFYRQMALLERRLREETEITVKFKKTVAQMLDPNIETDLESIL